MSELVIVIRLRVVFMFFKLLFKTSIKRSPVARSSEDTDNRMVFVILGIASYTVYRGQNNS